ncbi:hypothetical protein [Nocardia wallacei]|uniref:hypothetical protein n=1 Tax=Nocardia wallacei TaxID=480035 RepID=UPI002455CB2E|nr:hypothetical protein [Nocardia wallacei]
MYSGDEEIAYLGRLRRVDRLTVLREPDHEGLRLWFHGDTHEPLTLRTKPGIRLSWDVRRSASGSAPTAAGAGRGSARPWR